MMRACASSLAAVPFQEERDDHVRPFLHETLGGGQAYSAVAASDHRDFSRQFLCFVMVHRFIPF